MVLLVEDTPSQGRKARELEEIFRDSVDISDLEIVSIAM
jgi:hypothetical protein